MIPVLVTAVRPASEHWRRHSRIAWADEARVRFYRPYRTACPDCRPITGAELTLPLPRGTVELTELGLSLNTWWGHEARWVEGGVGLTPFYRDPDCSSCHSSESPAARGAFAARFFDENSRLTGLAGPVAPDRDPSPSVAAGPDEALAETQLEALIMRRRSARSFKPASRVDRSNLEKLLRFSCGSTGSGHRAAPSGGALYALTTYLVIDSCDGFEPGVYVYDVERDRVRRTGVDVRMEDVKRNLGYPSLTRNASVVCVLAGALDKVAVVYSDRGYRLLNLEAGHVAQNLCLLATERGLASCPLMAFNDAYFNRILGGTGSETTTLYAVALGEFA